jgi:flagellar motor switch protein FliG
MESLENRDPAGADRIRSLMFTFADMQKLDNPSIQTVLRVVDKTRLALALKGASETLKNLFLNNMSERAAKLLREDMDAMGMVKLKDVDEAQVEIVKVAKEMAQSGEIVISAGNDEEEMIG